jgi:hypothetical protein
MDKIMKIGAFYQSGHKLVACHIALKQLRKIYPSIPIALYEDGRDILKATADEFSCAYKKIKTLNTNSSHWIGSTYSGRPVRDLESNLAWLSRIYESCQTTLSNVDLILHYEDDVWCRRTIETWPEYDVAGYNGKNIGPIYTQELIHYMFQRFRGNFDTRGYWSKNGSLISYGACGGSIFSKNKFMEAYERISEIDWNLIYNLDTRPCEWSDASLSFIMQHAGFSYGVWSDWAEYETKNISNNGDKTGWTTPFSETPNAAFIHLYKHFYDYNNDELSLALDYYNNKLF